MVDNDDYDDEYIEFIEQNFPAPRGKMGKNHTIAIRLCRNRIVTGSATGQVNMSRASDNGRQNRSRVCEIRYVPVKREKDLDSLSQGGIPQDILDQLEEEMGGNSLERQKRSHHKLESYRNRPKLPNETDPTVILTAKENRELTGENQNLNVANIQTDADTHNKTHPSGKTTNDLFRKFLLKDTNLSTSLSQLQNDSMDVISERARNRRELWSVSKDKINKVDVKVLSKNEVLEDSGSPGLKMDKMEESLNPLNYNYKDPKKIQPDLEPMSNSSDNQTYGKKSLESDYDDYSDEGSVLGLDHHTEDNVGIRSTESRFRSYYIAAEEIMWDYGINKPAQLIKQR